MNRSQFARDADNRRVPTAIIRIFPESSTHSNSYGVCEAEQDDVFDAIGELDGIRLPVDLLEAADDAEALLEATGLAAFHLPDGFRLFRVPTERVM